MKAKVEDGTIDSVTKNVSVTVNQFKDVYKLTYSDGTVYMPEGFKIADDSASTVQGGVVIEDKDGNQFVWVPVATIADYKRVVYSTNLATEETDMATNSIKINYSSSANYYFTEALPEDERTSVDTYKGFYIGRYEAGDKESTKAKTKLVSSYAWDTTIEFLQKVNSDYGNSSSEGNYKNTSFSYKDIAGASQTKASGSSILVPTGQTTPVCNIYDMGRNVWEWTTESYSNTSYPRTLRGGSYYDDFATYPAGHRPNYSDDAHANIGFRLTLFM